MGLELTTSEYKKLWAKFDRSGDGKIDYAEFNNHIGGLIHPKTEMVLKRPETPKIKDWQKRAMARGLKKKVKDIEATFKAVDMDNSGYISHQEFYQLLRKLGMAKISNEDSYSMMQQYRDPANDTGEMTYAEFYKCITDYMKIPSDLDEFEDGMKPMALADAEKIMATKLFNKFDKVQKAFRLYDEDKSGELSYDEFRNMIRSMNVGMTNEHIVALIQRYDPDGDGSISYDEFCKMVGPLIHPDAKNTSKAHEDMMVKSGAQDGLIMNANKKFAKVEDDDGPIGGFGDGKAPAPTKADEIKKAAAKDDHHHDDHHEEEHAAGGDPQPPEAAAARAAAPAAHHGGGSAAAHHGGAAHHGVAAAAVRRAGSVATSQLDVNATEEKMRRVLGKSWTAVYKQVKDAEAAPRPDAFRDMMAERGVPLTSKEVRALGLKYGAGEGAIDAQRLLTSTFQGKAAPRPGSAAVGAGAKSAFSKPPSAAGSARPGTATGKAVF